MVLPIAVIGGTYLFANSRVVSTTSYVTQAIAMTGFEAVGLTPGSISSISYRVNISVDNGTADAAQVAITDARLILTNASETKIPFNGLSFDIIGSADWHDEVSGKSYLVFEGDIVISLNDALDLGEKPLILRITGTVTAKARYAFVENVETRPLNIVTEVIIPPPSVITQDAPTETEYEAATPTPS